MAKSPAALLIDSSGNYVGIVDIGGIKHLQTEVKRVLDALPVGDNRIGRAKITDDLQVLTIPVDGDTLGASAAGLGMFGRTDEQTARWVLVDDQGRVAVTPKPPTAPPGTTPLTLAVSEANLTITGSQSPVESLGPIISNGVNVYVQTISAGSEGDVSESGSVFEIYWREGNPSTDHLITRVYISGSTVNEVLPDVNLARDGTQMTGDGATTRLVAVRRRLSQAGQEVDFEVRGYSQ